MKRPNGVVPKSSRGLWRTKDHRPRKGSAGEVTADEIRSIKLGILPEGDYHAEKKARKKAAKRRMNAIAEWDRLNPKPARIAKAEPSKPRVLPDLTKRKPETGRP